ncbi:ABC transporter substrate-binding protein [Clostridium oryzae]|uniref:DUF3502 domain-containing protein n=1 Tax=Clostridium oryzae TaxID=1450648 RepID=A0A1V4IXB9_9CLOT|nr:ABC transporter substrate-binding protein [Clostridium oryzae]OPJ64596.1 hypothetical protein CLORY_04640 [Clostridium oryzae]
MKHKKIICTVLSVLMAGAVITGCGKKDSGTASKSDGKLKPYTIKFYQIGTPQKDTSDVIKAANKYLKKKINATLDFQFIDWGDYTSKMQVMINSGEKFDIAFTCSWANDYVSNAKKGAFLALDDLMDKYGKDMKQVIDPKLLSSNKVNGKLYAVPANKEIAQQRVFRFNDKYVQKYHIDISKLNTYESLEPVLKKIHAAEPDMKSVYRAESSPVELNLDELSGTSAIDMDIDAKDNKFKNFFEFDKTKNFLKLMRKYYKAGYIRSDAVAASKNGTDCDKTGNWFVDTSTTQPYADKLWSASFGYKVDTVGIGTPVINNSSVSGSMLGISVTAEDPDRDMMFLNLLNTDKYLRNLLNYGIEGKHYTKNSDGTISITSEGTKNYSVPGYAFGNLFNTYLTKGTPKDKWQKFKEFNESAISAPTLGFSFDQTPVKTELASLANIMDEYRTPLVTGSVDPDQYTKKAVDKLKAAGIDKVIAEAQKQFDAWKK